MISRHSLADQLKKLFWVSRPVSWVNTAYPFAAAYVVTQPDVTWSVLVIGTIFFLIPYNLLMYGINDVFDYESDLRNPRKGGIEGALMARSYHRIILITSVVVSIPFIAYLLTLGPVSAKLWLLFAIFMVVAYSAPILRFKERPVLDSFTSATHFVSPMVYALLLTGFPTQAWPAIIAFYAWGMASHAFGAVQDIKADRAGGIASIATIFGARLTMRLVIGLYLIAVAGVATYGWPGLIAALPLTLYVANAVQFWRVTDATAESANSGWRRFIWLNFATGFVITMVLIMAVRYTN